MRWTASVVGYGGIARYGSMPRYGWMPRTCWPPRTGWLAACGLVLLLSAGRASAAPYWVAYEGDVFPEDAGWTRVNSPDDSVREIRDGVFVLDTRANDDMYDFYEIRRPIDPEPGELFVAEWRVRIVENRGGAYGDAGVSIAPDSEGALGLRYFESAVNSTFERWTIPMEPSVFHSYRLESSDMQTYSFWLDDMFIRFGAWDRPSVLSSFFAFGDSVLPASSTTEWDYVRFGVVPEVSPALGLMLCGLLFRRGRL